jgi:hypothetical protein
MKRNIGSIDRGFRIVAGIGIIAVGYYLQSWWGAVGLVPLATGLMRWCPAYTLAGVNTCGCETTKSVEVK